MEFPGGEGTRLVYYLAAEDEYALQYEAKRRSGTETPAPDGTGEVGLPSLYSLVGSVLMDLEILDISVRAHQGLCNRRYQRPRV